MDVLALFRLLNISILIDFQSANPEEMPWKAELVEYAILQDGEVVSATATGITPKDAFEKLVKLLAGKMIYTLEHTTGTSLYREYNLPKGLYL